MSVNVKRDFKEFQIARLSGRRSNFGLSKPLRKSAIRAKRETYFRSGTAANIGLNKRNRINLAWKDNRLASTA
jgi:hypothetical protein